MTGTAFTVGDLIQGFRGTQKVLFSSVFLGDIIPASVAAVGNVTGLNLSGTNTGDQDLSGLVTKVTTVNGHPLSANITVTASDVSLGNVTNVAQIPLSYLDTDATLSGNSDTKVATQKATKAYADQLIAAANAVVYKGVLDCSASPNYPAASGGWFYLVSVAGKIGGASGLTVEVGDMVICLTSTAAGNQATVGANWNVIQANLTGVVIGPSSSTDGGFPLYDGVTGKLIKNSAYSPSSFTLSALTSANIYVGNVSNIATAVAVSGDLTLANTGAFTVAKIAGVTVGTPTGTGNVVMSSAGAFSGVISTSQNGAASAPAVNITGTPYAGTGTTSYPLVYINTAGSSQPTGLSTGGTMFGLNSPSGFAGNLLALYANGTVEFSVGAGGAVSANGAITSGNILQASAGSFIRWGSTRAAMQSTADGIIMLSNAAATDFNRIDFGGTTSTFPALQRSGAGIVVRLADDSANAALTALSYNKVTLTAPATGSTLTIADGKTLTASNTLTLTGTDGSSVAFGSGGTVAYLGTVQAYSKQQTLTPQALTSTTNSIAWDANSGNNAAHTATENTTLANPTNLVNGTVYTFTFTQHASAAKTLAYGSKWKFSGSSTVTTTVGAQNVITGIYDSTKDLILCTMSGPYT